MLFILILVRHLTVLYFFSYYYYKTVVISDDYLHDNFDEQIVLIS